MTEPLDGREPDVPPGVTEDPLDDDDFDEEDDDL